MFQDKLTNFILYFKSTDLIFLIHSLIVNYKMLNFNHLFFLLLQALSESIRAWNWNVTSAKNDITLLINKLKFKNYIY